MFPSMICMSANVVIKLNDASKIGSTHCLHSNAKFVYYFRFNFGRVLKKNCFCKNILLTYAPVFSNISKTTGATVPIFELDLTIVNTIILSHNWLKLMNLFE